ncbi:MAG TPA: DUF4384 domain-containing protein [Polyangiales bacterium]|nr:DUF4384 domain-containing protein [Polyangiales bacterium]
MNAMHPNEASCPSRLRFDRLIAGELEPAQARELERHAHGCARCGALLDGVRRDHAAFAEAALPDAVVQRVQPRKRSTRWSTLASAPLAAGPLLAAAGVLIVWSAWAAWPAAPNGTQLGEVRTKGGGPTLGFYVLHDGVVRPGIDGERVQPGDRLEFAYSSVRDAYLAVVSVDAARKTSAYYAQDGHAVGVSAASRAVLDRSTELDGTLSPERVYALLCDQAIAVEPVLRALEREPEAAPVVPGCTVERYSLLKVAR